uniref:Mos1 transposase HTH domain-containing protein n=1 Tax=Ditylenchus dipsaci TaxID=166011 RepID=A0A915EGF7_9BILA
MTYHFEKEDKAAETFRDLTELFGEGSITQQQVQRWFKRFRDGETSLEDFSGRGRPSDFDDEALLAAVKKDKSLTTRILTEQFGVLGIIKAFGHVESTDYRPNAKQCLRLTENMLKSSLLTKNINKKWISS